MLNWTSIEYYLCKIKMKNMKVLKRYIKILLFIVLVPVSSIVAQEKLSREAYINKFKDLAIEEMSRTGIPASITMAQAILESNNGNSTLAVKAKNHFGIKCHSTWNGKSIRHDDDKRNECFRKYEDDIDSYKDHSDFLINGSRYDFLFEYKTNDYTSWAKGLKKAGYATSKTYATSLIKIIEDYQLYQLDQGVYTIKNYENKKHKNVEIASDDEFVIDIYDRRKVYQRNRIDYIIAREDDTFEDLARELEMMPWQFRKYNDVPKDYKISEGEVLFLQPKRLKAEKGNEYHILEEGQNMQYISQRYGVKLSSLYKKNLLEPGSEPEPGTKILLRKVKEE